MTLFEDEGKWGLSRRIGVTSMKVSVSKRTSRKEKRGYVCKGKVNLSSFSKWSSSTSKEKEGSKLMTECAKPKEKITRKLTNKNLLQANKSK